MSGEPAFEYDVFLSFSIADVELVRPIWQQLTLNGLRVFWSDASLRGHAGSSWFDVIQDALGRSRHLVLVCTPQAFASKWVKREYVAFFNHQYSPPARLFVPVLTPSTLVRDLPLFLREIESVTLSQPDAIKRLIRVLGGADIAGLKNELARRDQELALLRLKCEQLTTELAEATGKNQRPEWKSGAARKLSYEEPHLNGTSSAFKANEPAEAIDDRTAWKFMADSVVQSIRDFRDGKPASPRTIIILILVIAFLIAVANGNS